MLLIKDLGGEGQPAKPEDEKGKEGGEDKGGEEDKAAAAQAMFDPKADPAMGARLDREKAANDKLAADAEKDKEAEKPKEEPPANEPSKPDTTPPVDAEKPKTSKKIKVRKPIQSAGEEEPTGASTQYPEKFHMGGAYYSSNEDGSPEFKSVEGKLIPLSDTEKEFIKVNKLDPAVLGRVDKLAADGGTDIESSYKKY